MKNMDRVEVEILIFDCILDTIQHFNLDENNEIDMDRIVNFTADWIAQNFNFDNK